MMPSYLHPGVYVEEISSGDKPIGAVSTSVTAFVGWTRRGPLGKSMLLHSWRDYVRHYGPVFSGNDCMGLAVTAFFENGGKDACVCRLKSGRPSEYESFFAGEMIKTDGVSIVVLPGQNWPTNGLGNPAISSAIAYCKATRSSMVIFDPAPGVRLDPNMLQAMALPASPFAALYYPWVEIRSPVSVRRKVRNRKETVAVPPSAVAAGLWARTDAARGVWKAPAGLDAGVYGVVGMQYLVGDAEQNRLNPLGVNCLRNMTGMGPVIWGSRTLASQSDSEWRYVPVRRTAIMIEQSICSGIQWAVFEPNNHTLWSALRANIGGFMNGLFRAGAFQGEKASDAYFVRCGLGDTMTQVDIDGGQVVVEVGFAPLKPAEFVIVRIQQKVGQE